MNQQAVEFDNLVHECGAAAASAAGGNVVNLAEFVREYMVKAYLRGVNDGRQGKSIPLGNGWATQAFPMSDTPPFQPEKPPC